MEGKNDGFINKSMNKNTENQCDTSLIKKHHKLLQKKIYRIDETSGKRDDVSKIETMKENSSFGSAFAAARSAGLQTFEYGGKSFTTRRAGESISKWKSSLKPASSASSSSTAPVPMPRRADRMPKAANKISQNPVNVNGVPKKSIVPNLDRTKFQNPISGADHEIARKTADAPYSAANLSSKMLTAPNPVVKVAPKKPNAGPSGNPANEPKPVVKVAPKKPNAGPSGNPANDHKPVERKSTSEPKSIEVSSNLFDIPASSYTKKTPGKYSGYAAAASAANKAAERKRLEISLRDKAAKIRKNIGESIVKEESIKVEDMQEASGKPEQDGVYRAKVVAAKKFNNMTGHQHKGITYWNSGDKNSPLSGKHPGKPANGRYRLRVVEELIAKRFAELFESKWKYLQYNSKEEASAARKAHFENSGDACRHLVGNKLAYKGTFKGPKPVKESEELEEAKLIKTHTSADGKKVAKVYRDAEWDEYHVKHYTDGKYHSKADYHTDDKDDAHNTAKHFVKEEFDEIDEGKSFKASEDDDYKSRKNLRDKLKQYVNNRREGKTKRQVSENYPEVRSLNKKKRPSKTAAEIEPTGIR